MSSGRQPDDTLMVRLSRQWRYDLPELSINRVFLKLQRGALPLEVSWASTGDELYHEQEILGGCGLRRGKLLCSARGSLKILNIQDKASEYSGAFEFEMAVYPSTSVWVLAGAKGWLGSSERDRHAWGLIQFQPWRQTGVSLSVQSNFQHWLSYSLGFNQGFGQYFQFQLLLTDDPARCYVELQTALSNFSITTGVSVMPPLGWTQNLGIQFQW